MIENMTDHIAAPVIDPVTTHLEKEKENERPPNKNKTHKQDKNKQKEKETELELEIILSQEAQQKYDLIIKDLAEVVGMEELKKKLMSGKPLRIYWGTAPTGRIHIGYFFPMKKIADFLKAGCEVTILLADMHAFLDNMKSPLEKVAIRTEYYKEVILGILDSLEADHSKIRFVVGSSFQLSPKYTMDLFKLGNITSIGYAQKAGTEVVKQTGDPMLTSLMYPLMQALDEQYLDVDVQFGGVDQRKIFMYSREYMPLVGYQKRVHLMNPMVGGFSTVATSGEKVKMSASDKGGKVDLLFTPKEIQKTVSKVYCLPGDIKDNTLMGFMKSLVFPILEGKSFVIDRPEKFGGALEFKSYEEVEKAFEEQRLHPADLKLGVSNFIVRLTDPIRARFSSVEKQLLLKTAYE